MTILIIEDDISILRVVKDNLEFEGYRVHTATSGTTGLEMALSRKIDLLLLDIMLPGINGYEICRRVKKSKPELPVIMVTARGSEIDTVTGLDTGADDYIQKPFSVPELVARVRAVLRRIQKTGNKVEEFSFGNVLLNLKKFTALVCGNEIRLSAKEVGIMQYLIMHQEEVVTRDDLLENVWNYTVTPSTRTVDNYILNLRKKFEPDPANPKYIISVKGAGYKFCPVPEIKNGS